MLIYRYFVYSLDATRYYGRLGRFVNDSEDGNTKMTKIGTTSTPLLVLFATRTIEIGDEIRYDYGGTNQWWRKKVSH